MPEETSQRSSAFSRELLINTPPLAASLCSFHGKLDLSALPQPMATGTECFVAAISFLRAYPETLLSFFCFFFFYHNYPFILTPEAAINWPLVGMFPGLLRHLHCLHEWITHLLRKLGWTNWFLGPWFLGMDQLVTCDPANVHHIFGSNSSNYTKGAEYAEIFDILGEGIFNSDDESWRKQRARAHGVLASRSFRAFVAKSSRGKVEDGLVPLLEEITRRRSVVDLQDVFLRLTFDMTSHLVFGEDPRCLSIEFPTVPFARAIDDAMSAIFARYTVPPACWKVMRWLRVGKEKKLAEACRVIDGFIDENIANKKKLQSLENHDDEDGQKADLLSSYINQEDEDRDQKFLRDTAVNFMLAGRDTTGVALSWFFWLLAVNPVAEHKILEELSSIVKQREPSSSDEPIAFDTEEVSRLVYLHAALCEALRLFPPVPFEHKIPVQPDILPSGHRVKQGTKILVITYSMARMEEIWGKDCMEFRPERWISEKGRMIYEPSYKFLSFNSGPRTCLGKEVAFIQMKTVVAAVLYNFQVELLDGQVVEPKLSIILQMKNGLKVRIKRRVSP